MTNERPGMEIYVHIPYCVKKCRYCDFLSFPCRDPSGGKEERYVKALLCEIARMRHGRGKRDAAPSDVTSVFIGGGTPSVLPAEAIRRILDRIREVYFVREDAEITMEANPGTVTEEKARIWKAAGVNRLSMGL
ncbi:MAG: radical SAM protein, partial [[Clostridium] aminophilum]|uniref:radical SAM protein n=1 Tax=[Clostridium] aminophilum TaxID=1526 RepID=UPI0026EBC593